MKKEITPDHLISKLSAVFLSTIFFTDDRRKFGNSAICKPLIDQLNILQTVGIPVNFKEYKFVKLIVCGVTGDNLGINSILGFTESFSSNYCCRLCKIHKTQLKLPHEENVSILRNNDNYLVDVQLNNVSDSGIKEYSTWNSLLDFHVTKNLAVDCFHDLLEGVCHYDLILILNVFIKDKLFTLHELNHRIEIFNFGLFKKNSPPLFNDDSLTNKKLKLSGSEMYTLILFLPLLIGDKIPSKSVVWELFLHLREIILLTFRKKVSNCPQNYLQNLIQEHNKLYISISKSHLKPKFHFLIHYARVIENIGPVNAFSSIRFESKHQSFKKTINISNNRVNILQTMAGKNQISCSNLILNSEENFNPTFKHTAKKIVSAKLKRKFNLNFPEELKKVRELIISNLVLKIGVVICVDVYPDGEPEFAIVEHIVMAEKEIFLCLQSLTTISFDRHYFAFNIEKDDVYFSFNIKKLVHKYTSNLSFNANGSAYVIWDY